MLGWLKQFMSCFITLVKKSTLLPTLSEKKCHHPCKNQRNIYVRNESKPKKTLNNKSGEKEEISRVAAGGALSTFPFKNP